MFSWCNRTAKNNVFFPLLKITFSHLANLHAVKLHLHHTHHRLEKLRTWSTRLGWEAREWKGLHGIALTFASYICHPLMHIMSYMMSYIICIHMSYIMSWHLCNNLTLKIFHLNLEVCSGRWFKMPRSCTASPRREETKQRKRCANQCDNVHPELNRLKMDISEVF